MITRKIKNYFECYKPTLVALLCVTISLVFFTPNITIYLNWMENSTLSYIVQQIEEPFTIHTFDSNFSHEAKLGLRLTVPLLMKLLYVNNYTTTFYILYLIKLSLCFVFFRHLYKKLLEIQTPQKLVVLFLLNLAVIYLGYSFSHNTVHFDEIAFFLIYFAFAQKHKFIQGLCIIFAVFTDERAIFSVFIGIIMKIILEKQISFKLIYPMIILIITLVTRQLLGLVFDLFPRNADGGIVPFQLIRELRISEIFIGVIFSFKFLWIFLNSFINSISLNHSKFIGSMFVCLIFSYLAVGMSVIDVTRTVSYLFPILIIPFIHYGIPSDFELLNTRIPSDALLILSLFIPTIHVESTINVPANILIKIISLRFGIMPS
jgi:hypothetical protein